MTPIEISLIIIASVLAIGLIVVLILFVKKSSKIVGSSPETTQKLQDIVVQNEKLQTQIDSMQKTYADLSKNVGDTGKGSIEKLATLSEKIETMDKFQKDLNRFNSEIKTNLDTLQTSTKNIPSISAELKGITEIYTNSKNRGNFGEFQLKTLLEDIFGVNSSYVSIQHRVQDGVVDFMLTMGGHNVPIDVKFPLDNYKKINEAKSEIEKDKAKQLFRRDIVAKFKEVEKYVSPKDNIENVIIFIPSEGIFNDIVSWFGERLLLEANEYHVFLSSPTTITVLLKLFVANEKDKNMSKNVETLKKQLTKVFADFQKSADGWNEYIKTLLTLINKAKSLTHTNNQVLKGIKRIEDTNQPLLDEVEKNMEATENSKRQLELEGTALKDYQENDNEH
ncbi:MAG: DNA recombination protein RmuC [Mycoplasmataceae bacterium]|jgi:DNA recombination protein RmuC|nr:DNA recombination protein RmuC [Mycoplasmataceae bacterium]